MQSHPYKHVSKIYSHLMAHINYRKWAEYYYCLTKKNYSKNSKVLELAAGNGKLAGYLRKYYPQIIVSDISPDMLKQAELKNRICFDMTRMPLKGKFNLIFCSFDSVNYLLKKKMINDLFSEVFKLLSDDGMFSFDVSLEKNSLKNVNYLNSSGRFKNYDYVQKSIYNKITHIHYNKFEIHCDDGTMYFEEHKQKIYPIELYFSLLDKNCMYVQNCFDAFSFKDAGVHSERVQFIIRKDKNRC